MKELMKARDITGKGIKKAVRFLVQQLLNQNKKKIGKEIPKAVDIMDKELIGR